MNHDWKRDARHVRELQSQLTAAQERTRRIVEAGDEMAGVLEDHGDPADEPFIAAYREAVGGE